MNMKKKTYPIVLLLMILTQSCWAFDTLLSLGNLSEFVTKVQTDDSGTLSVLNFNPYLALAIDYKIENTNLLVSPELGMTFPKSGRDSNTNRWTFYSLLNSKYLINSFFLDIGAGLFFTRVGASGGSEILNNGSTTTSFPLPDKSTLSRNAILNIGTGYKLNNEWHIELRSFIFNLTSNDDRSFSILMNGTYNFGEL